MNNLDGAWFAQVARSFRERSGLKWIAWSDAMGVALSTVQSWEKGKKPRHAEALVMKMEQVVREQEHKEEAAE